MVKGKNYRPGGFDVDGGKEPFYSEFGRFCDFSGTHQASVPFAQKATIFE